MIEEVTGRDKDEVVTKSWYYHFVPGALFRHETRTDRDPASVMNFVAEQ